MIRQTFIIIALGLAASLHIYTATVENETRSSDEKSRQPDDSSSIGTCLADIASCRPGDRITIQGTVGDIWEPSSERAPFTVILRDQSGTLEVVHWLKGSLGIAAGSFVECTGTVDLYRGQLQLRLWSKGDIRLISCAENPSQEE